MWTWIRYLVWGQQLWCGICFHSVDLCTGDCETCTVLMNNKKQPNFIQFVLWHWNDDQEVNYLCHFLSPIWYLTKLYAQVVGSRILSAADDKTIKVWDLPTGRRLVTLRSHSDGVTCLQFNDFYIVSGSYDKTVKLWDFTVCWRVSHHHNASSSNYLTLEQLRHSVLKPAQVLYLLNLFLNSTVLWLF